MIGNPCSSCVQVLIHFLHLLLFRLKNKASHAFSTSSISIFLQFSAFSSLILWFFVCEIALWHEDKRWPSQRKSIWVELLKNTKELKNTDRKLKYYSGEKIHVYYWHHECSFNKRHLIFYAKETLSGLMDHLKWRRIITITPTFPKSPPK